MLPGSRRNSNNSAHCKRNPRKLEKQIAAWQSELALLETRLTDPALYGKSDPALAQSLQKRRGELSRSIEQTEERWLALLDEIEKTDRALLRLAKGGQIFCPRG